jgi:hypothetical protein
MNIRRTHPGDANIKCLVFCAAALFFIPTASADNRDEAVTPGSPAVTNAEQTPWNMGVSEQNKSKARESLADGNDHFVNDRYKEALTKYTQALTLWDHPAIAFNAVRALVQLENPVAAQTMLDRAMRFGVAPLGADVYAEAQNYKKLLNSLVATVSVSCKQPAQLRIDGEEVTCPGQQVFRLNPGRHSVVATQLGFAPISRTEVLLGGENPAMDIQLQPLQLEKTTMRFPVWIPWLVTSAGIGMVGVGAGLELSSRNIKAQYATAVRVECLEQSCGGAHPLSEAAKSLDDRWKFRHGAAISTIAIASAVITTGVVLIVLNRPRRVQHDQQSRPSVSLSVDFSLHGLVASGRF